VLRCIDCLPPPAKHQFDEATAAIVEGIHLARRCGFGLYHVDLLIESANLYFSRAALGDRTALDLTERAALGALNGIRRSDDDVAAKPDLSLESLVCLGAARNIPLGSLSVAPVF
jgi:hypothetical protein